MINFSEQVCLAIYRRFAASGVAPSREDLAEETGLAADVVKQAITDLVASRHIVLPPPAPRAEPGMHGRSTGRPRRRRPNSPTSWSPFH